MRKFLDNIERDDWRNAFIGSVVAGALPVVGIGWFLIFDHQLHNDPQVAIVLGAFLLVAGGMFGVFGAAITLMFSVMIRQWPRATSQVVAEYQAFADAVGGKLHLREPPWPFRFLGRFPQRVSFSHDGCATELEMVLREPCWVRLLLERAWPESA